MIYKNLKELKEAVQAEYHAEIRAAKKAAAGEILFSRGIEILALDTNGDRIDGGGYEWSGTLSELTKKELANVIATAEKEHGAELGALWISGGWDCAESIKAYYDYSNYSALIGAYDVKIADYKKPVKTTVKFAAIAQSVSVSTYREPVQTRLNF